MLSIIRAIFVFVAVALGSAATATERSSFILASQLFLNELGYDAGPIDGIVGRRTNSALDTFYDAQGIDRPAEIDETVIQNLVAAIRESSTIPDYFSDFTVNGLQFRYQNQEIRRYCTAGQWSVWFPPETDTLYHTALHGEGTDLHHSRYSGWPFQNLLYRNVIRDITLNDLTLRSTRQLLLEAADANAFTEIEGHTYQTWNGQPYSHLAQYNPYNETEAQTHLVLHTIATVFHLARASMTVEEQQAVIDWGNAIFEGILQTPDDIDTWEDSRNQAHDRAAWKSMSLISWGIEAENYVALAEGLGHFMTNIDAIGADGRQNYWWRQSNRTTAQRIFYTHMTYGALTVAAHQLSSLGIDGFSVRGRNDTSLLTGLEFFLPQLQIHGSYKRVTEITRSSLNTLAYLELLTQTPYFDDLPAAHEILTQMRSINRVPQSTSRYGLFSLDAPGYTTCWFGRFPL